MIILSIDPGFEKTGYAVFDKDNRHLQGFKYLASGIIKTPNTISLANRLETIYRQLNKIIKKFKPTRLVFEAVFFFKNQKTIVHVAQSQGIILLISAQNNLDLTEYTPLQIKQIVTGYGLSDKKSVKKMIDLTLKFDHGILEDDEYDAIACGLAYCFQNNKLLQ